MNGFFRRSSTPADLEDAVRRRIIGETVEPQASDVMERASTALPSPAQDLAELEESPGSLLRNLAGALTRTGVEISTVRAGNDGFLVSGALKGAAFEQWYSVREVRQLSPAT